MRWDHFEVVGAAASNGSVELSEAAEDNRVEFTVPANADTGRRRAQTLSRT